ncbi:HD family hydrolase [Streptomyces sp. NPDC059720]|uniref:HD domain-containing protein n=1 Tax=Streptomyces sp. NPDC059720 TaxID=3346924 RepID=UPI0036B7E8EB
MTQPRQSAAELLGLVERIVMPMCRIERTIALPPPTSRRENDAEHSFGLTVLACSLAGRMDTRLNTGLIAEYATVHDVLEIYTGDLSVYQDTAAEQRAVTEGDALTLLTEDFGASNPWLLERVRDYLARKDDEGRFVYALDKMIPHAIVLLANNHPLTPTWSEYLRTEAVAKSKIHASYPALLPMFEEMCDMLATRPHVFRADEA